ncbi:hypothetical protein GE09DRAFT_1243395 [Coniochaeta sp. 2T2.1]|nr:hypothetical protein GE09DRAFT_1243395 [Coniochaeta sp. 2T2.1]
MMSTSLGNSNCPRLPPEIWTKIISCTPTRDLSEAWFVCRSVSRTLRAATELVFVTNHLPKVTVNFNLGMLYTEEYDKFFASLDFHFDRLSENGKRVHLTVEHIDGREAYMRATRDVWSEAMAMYPSKSNDDEEADNAIFEPSHITSLRRLVNDTPLPGLDHSVDNLTISFLWKEMFDMFMGDFELSKKLMVKNAISQSTPERRARSMEEAFALLAEFLPKFQKAQADIAIEARDRRCRLWWRRHHPDFALSESVYEDYKRSYRRQYKKVVQIENGLNFAEFSDDEAGEEYKKEEERGGRNREGNKSEDEDADDDGEYSAGRPDMDDEDMAFDEDDEDHDHLMDDLLDFDGGLMGPMRDDPDFLRLMEAVWR